MSLLTATIIFALIATVGALSAGIVSMVVGGDFDRKYSNQLMFARVGFQGIALVLLLVALVAANI